MPKATITIELEPFDEEPITETIDALLEALRDSGLDGQFTVTGVEIETEAE